MRSRSARMIGGGASGRLSVKPPESASTVMSSATGTNCASVISSRQLPGVDEQLEQPAGAGATVPPLRDAEILAKMW